MELEPAPPPPVRDRQDALLGDADFVRISRMVYDVAGIVLPEAKRPLVQSRLQRRLRALGLAGFSAYAGFLDSPDGDAERAELISAVTTNVTSFFREQHHFDSLSRDILPSLLQRARSGARIRLWSAGCSSGEEPYSMAAAITAQSADADRLDVRILATDIDTAMVARVADATYPAEALSALDPARRKLLFGEAVGSGPYRIAQTLRNLVVPRVLNLNDRWPMRGAFDVIFCRNVVIYFDRVTQERLWERFAASLVPGGALMIGHSERVTGPAQHAFATDGITTYRRR